MSTAATTTPKFPVYSVRLKRASNVANGVPDLRHQAFRKTVCFELAEPGAKHVYLAGTFNDWDATSLPLAKVDGDGYFQAEVPLRPGRYEYKFVVDGDWTADPCCPHWTVNEHGTLNSVLEVSREEA